jgi:hypothetical protein
MSTEEQELVVTLNPLEWMGMNQVGSETNRHAHAVLKHTTQLCALAAVQHLKKNIHRHMTIAQQLRSVMSHVKINPSSFVKSPNATTY